MPDQQGFSARSEHSLVVQQSFPDPRPTTNPYIVMLASAIGDEPDVLLQTFSWRRALLSRYDVFHAHWPEILVVSGQNPLKTVVRQLLTAFLLLKIWLCRIPVVRTAHNLALPSGLSRRQRILLRGFDRLTVLRIRLNPTTVLPAGTEVATIVHGHYRDWFAAYRRGQAIPGRLGYFGLIRRYKNVEQLLTTFAAMPGAWSLRIGGKPPDDLVGVVSALAAADDRVLTQLEYIEDAELVELVTESELIVLPYSEMHNSGAALTALSLGRPVLVPGNEVTDLLADEVGSAWVLRYPGEFTVEALQAALAELRSTPPVGTPDLSAREWSETGRHHVAAYRRAISLRRGSGVAGQR